MKQRELREFNRRKSGNKKTGQVAGFLFGGIA